MKISNKIDCYKLFVNRFKNHQVKMTNASDVVDAVDESLVVGKFILLYMPYSTKDLKKEWHEEKDNVVTFMCQKDFDGNIVVLYMADPSIRWTWSKGQFGGWVGVEAVGEYGSSGEFVPMSDVIRHVTSKLSSII